MRRRPPGAGRIGQQRRERPAVLRLDGPRAGKVDKRVRQILQHHDPATGRAEDDTARPARHHEDAITPFVGHPPFRAATPAAMPTNCRRGTLSLLAVSFIQSASIAPILWGGRPRPRPSARPCARRDSPATSPSNSSARAPSAKASKSAAPTYARPWGTDCRADRKQLWGGRPRPRPAPWPAFIQ